MRATEAVGAQPPLRKLVTLDSIPITYTDTGGSGPVIVCMHAIGHGARDFEDFSHRLAGHYRVIAFDFPGQGCSGNDMRATACGTRYAELLELLIDRLELSSIVLLGNSIGGATAVRYAASHPERVKALVLCNSGGLRPPGSIDRAFIQLLVHFFAAGARGAKWFPWAFGKYYRIVLREQPSHEQRNRIVHSAYEVAPVLEQAWRSFAQPHEDLSALLPSIRCPVLLAWAKGDRIIPLKATSPAFKAFTNHRIQTFKGGHAAFLEDPERFASAVRDFLDSPSELRP